MVTVGVGKMLAERKDYIWIDPLKLTESQLPIIILVEDRQGMVGWAIRWHNKSNYNHIQWMVKLGKVASQDPTGYKEKPIEKCMRSQAFMKFLQFDPIDREEIKIITDQIEKDLAKPWWKKRYDFLGIIGQFTGLRWIQSPWAKFCSERVATNLRLIPRLEKIIPKRPNPSELNTIFKSMAEMKLLGYWYAD